MSPFVVTSLKALSLLAPDAHVTGTPAAVVFGLTYNFIPFMTLPIYATLERLDTRLLEAGNDLYARPATTFLKVTVPLSMSGIVSGVLLTFIPAAGDYINASRDFLGGTGTAMIGQRDREQLPGHAELSGGGVAVDHPDDGHPGPGRRLRETQRDGGPAVTRRRPVLAEEVTTPQRPRRAGATGSATGCCRLHDHRVRVPAHPDRLHLRLLLQRLAEVEHRLARIHVRQVAERRATRQEVCGAFGNSMIIGVVATIDRRRRSAP